MLTHAPSAVSKEIKFEINSGADAGVGGLVSQPPPFFYKAKNRQKIKANTQDRYLIVITPLYDCYLLIADKWTYINQLIATKSSKSHL